MCALNSMADPSSPHNTCIPNLKRLDKLPAVWNIVLLLVRERKTRHSFGLVIGTSSPEKNLLRFFGMLLTAGCWHYFGHKDNSHGEGAGGTESTAITILGGVSG